MRASWRPVYFGRGDLSARACPRGVISRISRIVTYDGDLATASAPQSVTICLEDEIDISRGDMIVPALMAPHVARRFRSSIVWMNAKPLEPGRSYFIKHTSHQVRAVIRSIHHRLDVNTLAHVEAAEARAERDRRDFGRDASPVVLR